MVQLKPNKNMQIIKNEPLQSWNRWGVGGKADYFCQPENPEQLQEALQWAKAKQEPWVALGAGTNVLISDQGVKGLVISSSRLNHCSVFEKAGKLFIDCGAGVLKSHLMKIFKTHSLAPAVFLSGIPGDTGGGIVMNAGVSRPVHPFEFSQIVASFQVMSTQRGAVTYKKEDIIWSYRKSSNWGQGFVFQALLEWPLNKQKGLSAQIKAELQVRRAAQPLNKPSCGSVFKNPRPHFAGELIEKAGLKGLKKGHACVSKKHGNFILNEGGASASNIQWLIQEIQKRVYEQFAVSLEPEVRYMGRWDSSS